jgi:hypothetical protein
MAASPGPAPTRAATDPAPRSDTGASAGQHVLHLRRNPEALPRPRHLSLETAPVLCNVQRLKRCDGLLATQRRSTSADLPGTWPPTSRTTTRANATDPPLKGVPRQRPALRPLNKRPRSVETTTASPTRSAPRCVWPRPLALREPRATPARPNARRVTLVERPAGRRVTRLVSRRCRPGGRIERRSGSRGHGRQATTPIGGIATPSLSFCRWGRAGLSRWAVERGASPVTWRLVVTP